MPFSEDVHDTTTNSRAMCTQRYTMALITSSPFQNLPLGPVVRGLLPAEPSTSIHIDPTSYLCQRHPTHFAFTLLAG